MGPVLTVIHQSIVCYHQALLKAIAILTTD
jgi:hypothetical protein